MFIFIQAKDVGIELDPANLPADVEPLLFADTAADTTAIEHVSAPPPACNCLQNSSPQHSINSSATFSINQQLQPMNDWFLPMDFAEGLAPPCIPATVPLLRQGNLLSITLPLVQVSEVITHGGVKPY